jgi:3-dehydroquinate dehydratase/shikimate dehydrogenase
MTTIATRTPWLCETVTGRSMAELVAARDAATMSDLVELRLDGVVDVDVAGALFSRRRPAVVTCRPTWEGGRFDGSEEERRRILTRALELGAEFVDIEWRAGFEDLVRHHPEQVVLSTHDFDGIPDDLDGRVQAMRTVGAGTIKVAVSVSSLCDTLCLRDIGRAGGAVVIAMGDTGVPTRLLAARYGSRWSYAGAHAPGQLPARRMVEEFGFRRVGDSTRLFGVVSTSALHSLSPAMHNAAFEAAGFDAVYVPVPAESFGDGVGFVEAMGFEGLSVTVPFKVEALQVAAAADALTRTVGAANTLRRRGDVWEATNTDVEGFLAPLEAALGEPIAGARVAVLGAGGSARAVVSALAGKVARVTVHARRPAQAQALATAFGVGMETRAPVAGSWDVLVNCTPLGGASLRAESPLPGGPFTGRLVYDLTYGPDESPLLREARAAGCRVLDGLPMLAAQAERQFEWWTGQRPGTGVMTGALQARRTGFVRDSVVDDT